MSQNYEKYPFLNKNRNLDQRLKFQSNHINKKQITIDKNLVTNWQKLHFKCWQKQKFRGRWKFCPKIEFLSINRNYGKKSKLCKNSKFGKITLKKYQKHSKFLMGPNSCMRFCVNFLDKLGRILMYRIALEILNGLFPNFRFSNSYYNDLFQGTKILNFTLLKISIFDKHFSAFYFLRFLQKIACFGQKIEILVKK